MGFKRGGVEATAVKDADFQRKRGFGAVASWVRGIGRPSL
jgi:hypothetical protein